MTDFQNLRQNFEHVIEHASLRDIETMLRVIGNELGPRFHDASVLTYQAAESLSGYRRGKPGLGTMLVGDPPHPETPSERWRRVKPDES